MSKKEKDKSLIEPVVNRLKTAIEVIGYQDDIPKLGTDLGYSRPDNIYNAIGGDFFPGVQLLYDLSNKFESFDVNWVLTGKKKNSNPSSSSELKSASEVIAEVDPSKAILEIAATNKLLAQSNKDLTDMLRDERATANVEQQIPEDVVAMLHAFRELLLQVSIGKKYKSIEEAQTFLNRAVAGELQKTKEKDIQIR